MRFLNVNFVRFLRKTKLKSALTNHEKFPIFFLYSASTFLHCTEKLFISLFSKCSSFSSAIALKRNVIFLVNFLVVFSHLIFDGWLFLLFLFLSPHKFTPDQLHRSTYVCCTAAPPTTLCIWVELYCTFRLRLNFSLFLCNHLNFCLHLSKIFSKLNNGLLCGPFENFSRKSTCLFFLTR